MSWLIISCFLLYTCGVCSDSNSPNFIFVLTDDQDLLLNGLLPMAKSIDLIANVGVTFKHAFVNTPICCPSRSAILTGKYIHHIGVHNNSIEGNCSSPFWQKNYEKDTVANLLKTRKDYRTFYAGKYLNQYGSPSAGGLRHVPTGYDWWIGLQGNSKYYNYSLSINGTRKDFTDKYLTDVISDYALDFLNQRDIAQNPFFMMLAPPACHSPFTPAPRHRGKFAGEKALRTPSFNYSSADKHWLITMPPKYLPENVTILDEIQQHRLETLLAVDEMVENVINKLKQESILDKTYIIYTSDNGFHIGQFSQPWDKRQPYETDIRVPFFIRGPNVKKKKLIEKPISAIDITPTILDLASVDVPEDIDGTSFKDSIMNSKTTDLGIGINYVFVEYHGEQNSKTVEQQCHLIPDELSQCGMDNWCKCEDSRNNTYICVKVISDYTDFKYCQFYDNSNFVEAYDLTTDPYELKNIGPQLSEANLTYYNFLLTEF